MMKVIILLLAAASAWVESQTVHYMQLPQDSELRRIVPNPHNLTLAISNQATVLSGLSLKQVKEEVGKLSLNCTASCSLEYSLSD
jgi:hypothetical protein